MFNKISEMKGTPLYPIIFFCALVTIIVVSLTPSEEELRISKLHRQGKNICFAENSANTRAYYKCINQNDVWYKQQLLLNN